GYSQTQEAHRAAEGIRRRRDRGPRGRGIDSDQSPWRHGATPDPIRPAPTSGVRRNAHGRAGTGPRAGSPHHGRWTGGEPGALAHGRHLLPRPFSGQQILCPGRRTGKGGGYPLHHRGDEDPQPDRVREGGHDNRDPGRERAAGRVQPAPVRNRV
ncbi:MAG: Biotin carboxyl carrier protein of acetyl-CoA carboxylase, partial [Olavius algarvensis Gamma 1 endosymbiont]